MSTKIKAIHEPSDQIQAPLLDRMLQANKERSRADGIDIDAMSESNPYIKDVKKENHQWEDLKILDDNIVRAIVNNSEAISSTFNLIVQNKVEHPEELRLSVENFMNDMQAASEDILTIRKQYENKEGPLDPKKDLIHFTSITTDYLSLKDRISQLVLPAVLTLSEVQLELQEQLKKTAQEDPVQTALQDPKVISDVEFKESK